MLLPYLLALLMGVSAPNSTFRDSLVKAALPSPTTLQPILSGILDYNAQGIPTMKLTEERQLIPPNYYRFRDTNKHLWVTIVPVTTLRRGHQELIHNYLNTETADFIAQATIPDTAEITQVITQLRYYQRDNGTIVSGPWPMKHDIDDMRLEALDRRWKGKAPPPPPLPRKLPMATIETVPAGPSFTGRLPMHAKDLMPDSAGSFIAGPAGSDAVVSVRNKKWHNFNIDWAFYSTFLDGDTLTANMLGSDTDLAMRRLGLSNNTAQEYMVTIERYVINRHGKILIGPIFIGPMTKVKFDDRRTTPVHGHLIDGGIPLPSSHFH